MAPASGEMLDQEVRLRRRSTATWGQWMARKNWHGSMPSSAAPGCAPWMIASASARRSSRRHLQEDGSRCLPRAAAGRQAGPPHSRPPRQPWQGTIPGASGSGSHPSLPTGSITASPSFVAPSRGRSATDQRHIVQTIRMLGGSPSPSPAQGAGNAEGHHERMDGRQLPAPAAGVNR